MVVAQTGVPHSGVPGTRAFRVLGWRVSPVLREGVFTDH
jgi:hypothetical protein